MTRELYRFDVWHTVPATADTILARAALARTVHGLVDHGLIELLREHSRPEHASFTVRAAADVREGLLVVAEALFTAGAELGWLRLEFTCPRCDMTSHNPVDASQGYCGNCHDWTG